MDLAAGDIVRGRYRLDEHLGDGGFSTVWRAHDGERDRAVALKLPSFDTHDRETVRERFAREQRLLEPFASGLSHATVVRSLDGDLDAEPWYIALEYLDGDPLSTALRTGLGSGVRRRLAADLAETLDFIHRNDVVYLDLKPENVVVRRSGRPVLLDFNTAVGRDEQVDTRFGADQFKPPELLAGEADASAERADASAERADAGAGPDGAVGPWSDVYSWGKLAFYLLTGVKVETADVPARGLDPRTFGSTCSDALAAVIQQATRPGRTDRYTDGTELAAALAQATGRDPRLLVAHPSGVRCAVADGDRLGRLAADQPVPWVVLEDAEEYVAPRHARFERSSAGWELVDTSQNGTYVAGSDGWQLALGEAGYRTQREQGRLDPGDERPPTAVELPDGAVVAPVHPEYGIRLRVSPLDGERDGA
jgi:serine/threonine protein kinase